MGIEDNFFLRVIKTTNAFLFAQLNNVNKYIPRIVQEMSGKEKKGTTSIPYIAIGYNDSYKQLLYQTTSIVQNLIGSNKTMTIPLCGFKTLSTLLKYCNLNCFL